MQKTGDLTCDGVFAEKIIVSPELLPSSFQYIV